MVKLAMEGLKFTPLTGIEERKSEYDESNRSQSMYGSQEVPLQAPRIDQIFIRNEPAEIDRGGEQVPTGLIDALEQQD